MQAQVEQIDTVTEALEKSGFDEQQASALARAMGIIVQQVAVTPNMLDELLDERLHQTKEEILLEVRAQGRKIKAHGRDIRDLKKSMRHLEEDMRALRDDMRSLFKDCESFQRTMLRFMMIFTLLMLTTSVGALSIFFSKLT